MSDLKYASIEEQIKKLKAQNLIIEDENYAKKYLEIYGYSNLIKSYRDPYVITSENGKVFRSNVTFTQLCSLYILDKNLRNAVMAAMLDLEEYIKEAAADVISQSFGIHQNDYLRYKNYQNKKKYKRRFSLTGILESLNKTLDTDKEPIHHYSSKYGIVPPWILFKSVYLSTIVNFIDQFKNSEQLMMIQKLYKIENMSQSDQIKLMMDTLFIALEYRNIAAHGGRIYNYKSTRELHFTDTPQLYPNDFSLLLRLLNLLEYQSPYQYLEQTLNYELNRHCSLYPQDVTYLSQVLNINISARNIVWVTERSRKYHADPHCSGIHNAREIDLNDAKLQGFEPCKRCIK